MIIYVLKVFYMWFLFDDVIVLEICIWGINEVNWEIRDIWIIVLLCG